MWRQDFEESGEQGDGGWKPKVDPSYPETPQSTVQSVYCNVVQNQRGYNSGIWHGS